MIIGCFYKIKWRCFVCCALMLPLHCFNVVVQFEFEFFEFEFNLNLLEPFAKRFNKFDLNLNSTNSNSNQTTRNKTMQSGMSANKQPHLDLEKQLIFILTKFPVNKRKCCKILKLWENCLFIFNFNHILKSKNFRVWQNYPP